ncbi:MAG: nodulation protein NfeD [Xanthomonadales bacterium]|nr:nodulation protein NfeD [Gammaproteobacteria bacterium]MBT8053644.1 nodulation protein NfeD [Gammaproteobacteria bacterium]NND57344.1 nodulation protein NfeD [Xanthomonadales bacterium]NNK51789.1 nodulation protein NfeD [Xanthomonadales bacterium]
MVLAFFLLLVFWAGDARGQDEQPETATDPEQLALVLDIQAAIGPSTRDFITRSLEEAAERDAALVIIRMDTPGGLDASTRDIIKAILSSTVPVATFVAPEGARAASAGAYILLASHIAAMSPATNVGAATPVSVIGKTPKPDGMPEMGEEEKPESAEDKEPKEPGDAMAQKVVNDSVAYIRGLAERRGRNADWAERAVREADSITSEKALEIGVIDLIAENIGDLLAQIDGRTVEVNHREQVLNTSGMITERLEPDWRNELLGVITSPTIAYLLLLIGVYGLILEGYNPGAVVPGVVGAICLLMALYAFQMLPVNYAGLGLILLGIILMIAEVMAPSFGALGIGGVIAMVIGSIILIDTDVPGFAISRVLIGTIATAGSLGLMGIVWFAVRARNRPVVSGREQLIGALGTALEGFEREGEVFVHSERWHAVSEAAVAANQAIEVTGIDGLTLKVRPAQKS